MSAADGPDTELAAAIAWFDERPARAEEIEEQPEPETLIHAATIVRAVLARPAAGRDLTVACDFSGGPFADCTLAVPRSELPGVLVTDVGDSRSAYVCIERNGETVYRYAGEASVGEWEHCPRVPADAHVEEVARPAAARTDVQPQADDDMAEKRDHLRTLDDVFAVRAALLGVCEQAEREGRDVRTVDVRAVLAAPADDTAAPGPIETAARQLYAAIVAEHQRGETFPMRVSVCTNGLREALGETYPDDAPAAGQPVRDSQDGGDRG